MTESFAVTHFYDLAKRLEKKKPVFQHEDLFICQTPHVYEVHLYREASQQFIDAFPGLLFCLYKVVKYDNNNDFFYNRFILFCEKEEQEINFWYTFYKTERIAQTSTIQEDGEPIASLFMKTIEELPENRLLIETNAVPLITK